MLERYLYGTERLGTIYGTNVIATWTTPPSISGPAFSTALEMHDHLGNVRATFSGIAPTMMGGGSPVPTSINTVNYYHYYAFGAPHPNRYYEPYSSNRWGFNGQERKDDYKGIGNHNHALYWEYDTRIGRRWNLDPKYLPSESRYVTNADNPICFKDPNGDFRTKFGAWLYQKRHGGDIGKDNKSGQWFVGFQRNRIVNGELVVGLKRFFDWNGGSKPYDGSGWGHTERSFLANLFGVDGKVTNLIQLGLSSLAEVDVARISGSLLERLKSDPAVRSLENELVKQIQADSRYRNEAFEYTTPPSSLELGGKRGSLNPLSAESKATWQVGANPLTWAMRHATVVAHIQVNTDGGMHISYRVTDRLDLRPENGNRWFWGGTGNSPFSNETGTRPWQYNGASSILGVPYHDILGGNDQMKTEATWEADR